jgi:hypothetical protein
LLVASAAVDAVAVGILLFDTPLPPALRGPTAAICHATAIALVLALAHARSSRRWLFVAPVLAIPCVGVAVAAASYWTRGRGSFAARRRKPARRGMALTGAAIQQLGDALSPNDALDCGEEEQRRAALSALSRREDPDAIALLRRAAAGHDQDLALSAALILDDLGERAERRTDPRDPGGAA